MNLEIISALKQRAKEMLDENYTRKIGDEELYTIICEWENCYKDSELLNYTLKRFEEVLNDGRLEYMMYAVLKKENMSLRNLMEREMINYYIRRNK